MREDEAGGADAFVAARPARGAEGSNGCKPFVPEAGEKNSRPLPRPAISFKRMDG